jgi:hypothetical protein
MRGGTGEVGGSKVLERTVWEVNRWRGRGERILRWSRVRYRKEEKEKEELMWKEMGKGENRKKEKEERSSFASALFCSTRLPSWITTLSRFVASTVGERNSARTTETGEGTVGRGVAGEEEEEGDSEQEEEEGEEEGENWSSDEMISSILSFSRFSFFFSSFFLIPINLNTI